MDATHALMAEICRTLAHPTRIALLHALAAGPTEVGRLADALGVSQPNVSQHLAVMRAAGLVEARRDGREVHYRLADPGVLDACAAMDGVMRRRLARMAELSARLDGRTAPRDAGRVATGAPQARRIGA